MKMKQIIEKLDEFELQFYPLESAFELCEAREDSEYETVLTRLFLADLTQQIISRNLDNY